LVNITLSDGSYLVAGKDVAGKQKSSSLGWIISLKSSLMVTNNPLFWF
jgi:hypothetical protein